MFDALYKELVGYSLVRRLTCGIVVHAEINGVDITDTMQRQAAVHIDRKIGGTDARMPTMKREERKDTAPVEFTPYKPKIRKPGTGCVTMINDHLYEGRYTPTNAYGKRESHNIYAKTREECEEKLAEMIVQVKAQIKAEKDKMTG